MGILLNVSNLIQELELFRESRPLSLLFRVMDKVLLWGIFIFVYIKAFVFLDSFFRTKEELQKKVVILESEVEKRRRAEDRLQSVADGAKATDGADFFDTLTRNLCENLRCESAVVTECLDQPATRVRTLSIKCLGKKLDNVQFDLEGTPFEKMVKGVPAHVPDKLRENFPESRLIKRLDAQCCHDCQEHSCLVRSIIKKI